MVPTGYVDRQSLEASGELEIRSEKRDARETKPR